MPRYGPVLPFDGGVLIAQGYVAGQWREEVSDELGSRLLECRRRTVDRGVSIEGEPWGRFIIRTLIEGEDGWALHAPLRSHSRETRRVLDWIECVGTDASEDAFHERDLVHVDFHHRTRVLDGVLGIGRAAGLVKQAARLDLRPTTVTHRSHLCWLRPLPHLGGSSW